MLYRGRAFGLELAGNFRAPGVFDFPRANGRPAEAATLLERRPQAVLERSWPHDRAERIGEVQLGGHQRLTIDCAAGYGYRLEVGGWGLYLHSEDGRSIRFAPPHAEEWRWQRLLTAQALPLAALLQGRELLHASAVALHGAAIALIGQSGAGKTALAMHLALLGAPLITDDVLALSLDHDTVLAHPGPALVNLRHATVRSFDLAGSSRLGRRIGGDQHGLRLLVKRADLALPLRALYFLRRGGTSEPGVAIQPLASPDPRLLLSATFNSALRTPARLRNQLDIHAALARGVPAFAVDISAACPPAPVAERLQAHAGEEARR